MEWQAENLIEWLNSRKINGGSTVNFEYGGHWFEALGVRKGYYERDVYLLVGKSGKRATRTTGDIDAGDDSKKFYCFNVGEWNVDHVKDALDHLIAEFEDRKRERANDLETQAAILLKYELPKFDNRHNSFVMGVNSPHPNTAPSKPLVKLSAEDGVLVCRFKGEEFRIAGDGTTPESRQQLVAALREMLLKLPPEDGVKIVEHGMIVTFDAPELAKLIESEMSIKVVSEAQKEK